MNAGGRTVLILGAGINGCSVARELVFNGVGVWIVDTHDVACGATSRSSRLIHGGLRYLEYGDFHLVRESLAAEFADGIRFVDGMVAPPTHGFALPDTGSAALSLSSRKKP